MSDATESAVDAGTSEPAGEAEAPEAREGSAETETPQPAPPTWDADEVLLGSVALAQRALLEVTAPETVGSVIGHVAEGEHVLSLHFAADLSGYPGWHWSVTLARVEDGEPTVLETELMPGERALLAPEWVPWSERLAEYRAAQAASAAEAAARGDDEVDAGELDEDDVADEPDLSDEPDDEGFTDDESDDTDDDDVFDGIDIDALAEDGDGTDGDGTDERADDGSDDADEDAAG
jgi:hypothetical protein